MMQRHLSHRPIVGLSSSLYFPLRNNNLTCNCTNLSSFIDATLRAFGAIVITLSILYGCSEIDLPPTFIKGSQVFICLSLFTGYERFRCASDHDCWHCNGFSSVFNSSSSLTQQALAQGDSALEDSSNGVQQTSNGAEPTDGGATEPTDGGTEGPPDDSEPTDGDTFSGPEDQVPTGDNGDITQFEEYSCSTPVGDPSGPGVCYCIGAADCVAMVLSGQCVKDTWKPDPDGDTGECEWIK